MYKNTEMLKVIFFNNAHIGDTFLAQPFVKNIVDYNPGLDYYIYVECNDFIYTSIIKDIKNIMNFDFFDSKSISDVTSKKEHIKHHIVEKLNNICYYYNETENLLIINTWQGLFNLPGIYKPNSCDLPGYIGFYNSLINEINRVSHLNLVFNNSHDLILPTFPILNIDKFFKFRDDHVGKKLIFYYNIKACSGQSFPIKSDIEHNEIISKLADDPNSIIFIPYKNNDIADRENIIFVNDMFNLTLDDTCENVYYYILIASHCDISYYFDTGRCFLYLNSQFIKNNPDGKIRIHFACNDYYYNIFNRFFGNKPYNRLMIVHNHQDILRVI